ELARTLAEFLFGDEEMMIQVDMSEYMEKHSVSRLVGSPPGYVGYDEGGQLTEAVRRRPYAVILLDEIEKAHPDVFNALLQVLDDGRLTDGQGRTVDFKNTLIAMTSNIASQQVQDLTAKQAEAWEIEAHLTEALRQHFRPEFLNRIDETVIFHSLTAEHLAAIVDIQIACLWQRLADRHMSIEVTGRAKNLLGELGYDPRFGARPLKRLIQQKIENGLAGKILRGEIHEGEHVVVDAKGKTFTFRSAGPARPCTEAAAPRASDRDAIEGEGVE
ncbi:MAG: AAA family ATPase, partial [Phycisphaerae bacterium]|nr:AAA family ATPase [Phycisphaerae bacterium]